MDGELGFETRAIHAGQPPEPGTGAVVTPIFQTSTFAQSGDGSARYEYSRSANPTRTALESCLSDLEGVTFGAAFASGLAAEDAVLRCLDPGDHIIVGNELYGGTYRLLNEVHAPAGLSFTPVELDDPDASGWSASARWPDWPMNTTHSSWSTTRSPRPTSSSPSLTVPTSWCTPPPST
jgi:cystathionine gamma-synthase